MLQRSLSGALKLHCSARAFATRACAAQATCSHTLHAKVAEADDHFDGFSTYSAIRGVSAFSFGSSDRDLTLSQCTQHQAAASGVHYLQQAGSVAADHALVARLAAVWNIPAEILHANVRALQDLLKGCGRDTSAHALWAMVRCPELRHADGDHLRTHFRQLTEAVQHLELDKPTLLAVVYRRPWMLHAARAAAMRARMQGRKHNARSAKSSSAARNTGSSSNTGSGSESESDSEESNASGHSSSSSYRGSAPWNQELALLLMEWYASNAPKVSNSSISASPAMALAAVRSYLVAVETGEQLRNAFAAVSAAASRSIASTQHVQKQQHHPSTAVAATGSGYSCSSAVAQQQQVQQLQGDSHLQHLLEVCPPLTLLPPDILLSRWQLLLSGLFGSPQSAAALLLTNPYIVVSYADFEREDSPYEVEGF